jgi:pyruvate,water dikinase
MLRWRQIAPPSTLGSELASGTSTRVSVLFGNIDGGGSDRAIRGQPASAGTVTGIARLIRSLTEAHRLGPGEVLVAPTTSPPWTPLFGIAGALVTDGGGRLSHAAIVAREYGIAAVVGTVDATRRIRDGQLIRVDGTAGTVELLD